MRRQRAGARPDCARLCAFCGIRCNAQSCPRFEEEVCPRLAAAPYVCNGCPDETKCTLRKFYYLHKHAHEAYRTTLAEARQGVNLTEGELRAINEVLVPAMNKGQSPHHAMVSSPESFPVCERTIYNYANKGVLAVKRHNLPMAVRYKKRNGKPVEHKIDRHCTENRKWEDYLEFVAENPDLQIPQVDTVEGGRGDKCVLLTIMFPKPAFMIARLMPGKCAKYVADEFNWLWRTLGADTFRRLFPALLKDKRETHSLPMVFKSAREQFYISSGTQQCLLGDDAKTAREGKAFCSACAAARHSAASARPRAPTELDSLSTLDKSCFQLVKLPRKRRIFRLRYRAAKRRCEYIRREGRICAGRRA